jgi:hypothetical protein
VTFKKKFMVNIRFVAVAVEAGAVHQNDASQAPEHAVYDGLLLED